jgi:tight adherence protein C
MAATLVSILFFLVLMLAISAYGYRRYAKPGRYFEQLGGPAAVTMPVLDTLGPDDTSGLTVRVLQQIGEQVPISPADAAATRRDLIAAGYRSDKAVAVVYGAKIVCCLLFLVLAFLFRDYLTSNGILRNVLLVAAGIGGYLAPGLYVERLVTARHERLRFGLPDALDLMVISVEAGLGLDQAIQYVGKELAITHKDISEELALVNLEMRAGKRRPDALHNLADRTGEPELRKLVAILVQTDKFGTSIADSLRTHSDFMRVRRRQEAEERAGKVGVKLVFPIFFLILPAMLIVAAGPGLLQIFKYLFPMMKDFGH